jgi:hypothetical protein
MSLRLFRVSAALTKRLKFPNAQIGVSVFHFSNEFSFVTQRSYHVSTISFAKAKKGGKSDDDGPVVPLPDIKAADGQMENHIFTLSTELLKLKVGRANADTFNDIPVEAYGTVSAAGQVTLKGPTKVSIAVYDPTAVKAVADAIKASGLGVNPTVEGNNVIVNIPKPSKEARDLMVKAASKLSDKVPMCLFIIFITIIINNIEQARYPTDKKGDDGFVEEVQGESLLGRHPAAEQGGGRLDGEKGGQGQRAAQEEGGGAQRIDECIVRFIRLLSINRSSFNR